MNASIMYKAFGISLQECSDMRCESNKIFLNIPTPLDKLCYPKCGSHNVVRNGFTVRRFVSVPLGCSKTFVKRKIQRVKCSDCGCIKNEDVDFAKDKRKHTTAFANMIIDLSSFATIQDIVASPQTIYTCMV